MGMDWIALVRETVAGQLQSFLPSSALFLAEGLLNLIPFNTPSLLFA
jgi:hypothetical protein